MAHDGRPNMAPIWKLPTEILEQILDFVFEHSQPYPVASLIRRCTIPLRSIEPELAVSKRWATEAERSWWKCRDFSFDAASHLHCWRVPEARKRLEVATRVTYMLPEGLGIHQAQFMRAIPQVLKLCPNVQRFSLHGLEFPALVSNGPSYPQTFLQRCAHSVWLQNLLSHHSLETLAIAGPAGSAVTANWVASVTRYSQLKIAARDRSWDKVLEDMVVDDYGSYVKAYAGRHLLPPYVSALIIDTVAPSA